MKGKERKCESLVQMIGDNTFNGEAFQSEGSVISAIVIIIIIFFYIIFNPSRPGCPRARVHDIADLTIIG